ncbi:LamG-like jellyroll fold domain-containing protein [Plebeiibacterium sediminum]|uniref:T9SS type A sorting domain-containing protein n=1 Tax=Plebeiibacterium sediminum TaxID=2992112 RepID=A0AAE3M909_9BACT|nr:LamG-like jellyroll fold domain-containing protein [Plebeiobacterium sediminum]MCW3789147.1 T9SS type A sorting domain-containing protein [Plebeiobacterium sediminum]
MRKLFTQALFVVAFFTSNLVNAQVTNGLVGQFKFDGRTDLINTINPSYSFDANGTLLDEVDRFGVNGGAINLPVNSWLNIANAPFLPTGDADRSVSVWIKPVDNYAITYWAYGADGFPGWNNNFFGFVNTTSLMAYAYGNDYLTGVIPSANNWQHYVVTYGNSTVKIYIDGVEVLSRQNNNPFNTLNEDFRIGTGHTAVSSAIGNFKIDDLLIYNRELSAQEVSDLYNEERPVSNYNSFYSLEGNTTQDAIPSLGYDQNSYTIEADIYLTHADTYGAILMCRDGSNAVGIIANNIASNGDIRLSYNWGTIGWNWAGGPYIHLETHYHVAMVIEPTKITMYLDGVPYVHSNITTAGTQPQLNTLSYTLGRDTYLPASRRVYGYIDELKFWKRSLTVNEIGQNLNCFADVTDPDLLAYYNFETVIGEENTIVDLTGQHDIVKSGNNVLFLKDKRVDLDNSIAYDAINNELSTIDVNPNNTYNWHYVDPEGTPLVANTQSYEPSITGEYYVIISRDGCTKTSELLNVSSITTDVTSEKVDEINIYPNPAQRFLYIQSTSNIKSVTIYDITGNVVLVSKNTDTLDLQNIPNGTYILHINVNDEDYVVRKIIVSKNN